MAAATPVSPLRRGMRYLLGIVLCSLALLLSGCAARQAYNEGNRLYDAGQPEAGMQKLDEAVRLDPNEVEFRMAQLTRRTSYINAELRAGELARGKEQLELAEQHYQKVLKIEPDNVMARQGMARVAKDRHHGEMLYQAASLLDKGEDLDRATEILRAVLAADPDNRRAAVLLNKARAMQPDTSAKASPKLAAAFRKPVTLDFRDAPLSTVFDMIGKSSGLNFFFDHDVKSDLKTTITARNIPIETAVRIITTTNQLGVRPLDDSSLLVYPDTAQKQKDYLPVSVRTFYLANADVKTVSNTLKTVLNIKDMVTDERLNLIIVRDTPEVIHAAERIVAMEDQQDPEVLLDVEVLEIQRNKMTEAGITWSDSVTLSPLSSSGTTGGTATTLAQLLHLSRDTIQASTDATTITLHDENQDSNILANPRIRVRNKEKAKILIGDKLPVFTTTSTSTGFVSDSVTYLDVGLKLEVQPNVTVDQDVNININLEVSSIVSQVKSASGTQAYEIGTRNASTVLQLRDGETQLLAGLINDQESSSATGIPLLRQLPLIGRLFGTPQDSNQRNEVVLSITPHILRSLKREDLYEAEFDSGTGSVVGRNPLHFDFDPTQPKPADVKATPADAKPGLPAPVAVPAAMPITAPVSAPAPAPGNVQAAADAPGSFAWSGPASVKQGDYLNLSLAIKAPRGLQSLPLTLSYDPNVLQAVSVQEGDVMRKVGVQSTFGSRIEAGQGRIEVALARQAPPAAGLPLPAADGEVLQVRFKALKSLPSTEVSLVQTAAKPADTVPMALPLTTHVAVQP